MTPNPLRLSFSHAVGSRWLLYYPAFAWLLPLWLFGSVFSTPVNGQWSELFSLLWINVVALGVCSAEVVIFSRTLWRRSALNHDPGTPVWAVVIGGALLGMSKVVVTIALSTVFQDPTQDNLLGRLVASCALGIGVVCVIPIALTQLELYRTEREILIAELIRAEVSRSREAGSEENSSPAHSLPTRTSASAELRTFVETSLRKLAYSRDNPEVFPEVLDSIRQDEIRPLSHRIWRRENERLPQFTLSNLISVSLAKLNFVLLPIVLGYVLVVGPSILFGYGFIQGAYALALQLGIISLVVIGLKFLPRRGIRWGLSVYFGSALLMTSIIMIATTALFGPIPTLLPAQAAISILLSLLTLILATGVFTLAVNKHHEIHEDLMRLNPDAGSLSLQKAEQSRSDRELAQLLHSQVQNVFLSHSVQLKSKLTQDGLSMEERRLLNKQAITEIEQYLHSLLSTDSTVMPPRENQKWLEPVLSAWSPVLNIKVSGADVAAQSLSTTELNTLSHIITEAIANSLRHGLAQNVDIVVTTTEERVTITVEDDGVGPRHGVPGLGSYFFTAIPHSTWSLTSAQNLSGAKFELVWQRS